MKGAKWKRHKTFLTNYYSIDDLLNELKKVREENQQLRKQIVLLKAENEAKNSEISSLYDEISAKERELESVLSKIQNVLGQ